MDRLEGIKIFVRVVDSGSFFRRLRASLGQGSRRSAKQVAALEEYLGAQASYAHLPQSQSDRGRARLLRICPCDSSAISRQRNPASVRDRPRRPAWCASAPRPPSLASMSCRNSLRSAVRYPKVVIESLASERTSNLVEEGIDLAIRNGALADSSLIARKIGEFALVAVASADYLERRGVPKLDRAMSSTATTA